MNKKLRYSFLGLVSFILVLISLSSFESVKTILERNVVRIAIGTGFVFKGHKSKYVLTNFHVCYPMLYMQDQKTLFATTKDLAAISLLVIKQDPDKDLCAAIVKSGNLQSEGLYLRKNHIDPPNVYTLGYPSAVKTYSEGHLSTYFNPPIVYEGYMDLVDQKEYPCDTAHLKKVPMFFFGEQCQHTNLIRRYTMYSMGGASGSPVVDEDANLVGVVEVGDYTTKTGGMVTQEDLEEFTKDL